jgi:phage gp36-like protein
MSNYATVQMLKDRVGSTLFSSLAGADPGGSTLAALIIDRAEGKVDGYLAARYAIPAPPNGMLEDIALTLAEWELYRRSDWGSIPEKLDEARKEAMEMLREIAEGKLSLPDASAAGSELSGDMEVSSDDPVYDEMRGYL